MRLNYFLLQDFQFKIQFIYGAIAQLVARLHGMQEVTSSTLVSSTILISKKIFFKNYSGAGRHL